MSKCAMCDKSINAFSTHPDVVFCSEDCRDNWLRNAITEDIRIIKWDNNNYTYKSGCLLRRDFFGYKYFKELIK